MKPFVPDLLLPTTVVGSYPAGPRRTFRYPLDPFQIAVKEAVDSQIQAGITIISDGQVRGDMIGAFASQLPGIRGSDVIGKVIPSHTAITVKDTAYAVSRNRHVKAIITGPSSLSYGLHISTPIYRNRSDLVPDIAEALKKEAEALEKTGAAMLQIDEPIFSTGAADIDIGREAIRTITSGISIPICLHVCGSIGSILDDLLRMPIQILDFEGSCDPDNLTSFSKKDLKDRFIGYGCVASSKPELESVEEVVSRIERGVDILGPERLLLDPDCGLRMHTPDTAYQKLNRLTRAAEEVRGKLAE